MKISVRLFNSNLYRQFLLMKLCQIDLNCATRACFVHLEAARVATRVIPVVESLGRHVLSCAFVKARTTNRKVCDWTYRT